MNDLGLAEDLERGLAAVQSAVERAKAFGESKSKNGARLYGHVPHVAPLAWFHIVYPGLSSREIEKLEKRVGRPVPTVYKEFLIRTNGLSLYGALHLFGLRKSYSRDPSIREPFELETANQEELPEAAGAEWVPFGYYPSDGSTIYFDGVTNQVHRANEEMTTPDLNVWPSFGAFLASEVERLAKLFDDRGMRLDPDRPTCPDPVAA